MIHHHHWLQENLFQSQSYKNDSGISLVDIDHMMRPREELYFGNLILVTIQFTKDAIEFASNEEDIEETRYSRR